MITRSANRAAIEAYLSAHEAQAGDLNFVFVDLPESARRWKKGRRGVRTYYLIWQVLALAMARRMHRAESFDMVWHLTLANAWLGSTASFVGPPLVYGPVGGGVGSVPLLIPALGFKGAVYELARGAARHAARWANPLARLTWRRATLILAQNEETYTWFPSRYRRKAVVFPNVLLEGVNPQGKRNLRAPPVALYAGQFLPLKGVDLAIDAIEKLPEWRLVLCGSGSSEARLREKVRRAGIVDRVEFSGWVERKDLFRLMEEKITALIFPSLHDEAGWVVAEASALGVPTVSLDVGGPPVLARANGIAVSPAGGQRKVVARLAAALESVISSSYEPSDYWSVERRRSAIRRLLVDFALLRDSTST